MTANTIRDNYLCRNSNYAELKLAARRYVELREKLWNEPDAGPGLPIRAYNQAYELRRLARIHVQKLGYTLADLDDEVDELRK